MQTAANQLISMHDYGESVGSV